MRPLGLAEHKVFAISTATLAAAYRGGPKGKTFLKSFI